MTATNPNFRTIAQGNGSNKNFSYAFLIPDTDSLQVYLNGTLVSPSAYTVTGIGEAAGGVVTYPASGSAITSSDWIEIVRAFAYEQNSTFTSQGNFDPTSIENALDELALQTQQLAGAFLPRYATGSLPSARTRGLIAWNTTIGLPVYSDGENWRKFSDDSIVA